MFLAPATPGNSRIGLPQRVGDGAVRNESSGERIDHSETAAAVGLPPPRQPKHEGWQRSSGSRTGGAIAGLLAGSPAVLVGAGTCRRSPRNGFSLPHCSERQPCSCSTNRWRRREAAEASYVITSRRHPYGIHVRRRDKTGMIQVYPSVRSDMPVVCSKDLRHAHVVICRAPHAPRTAVSPPATDRGTRLHGPSAKQRL